MTIASSLLTLWMDIVAVGVANPAIDYATQINDHDHVLGNLLKVIEEMGTFKDDTKSHSYWDSPGGNNYAEYFNGLGGLTSGCNDGTPARRYTASVTNGKQQKQTVSCVVPAEGALTHIEDNLDSMIHELNILLSESRVDECYHKHSDYKCISSNLEAAGDKRDVTVEACQNFCSSRDDCVKISYNKQYVIWTGPRCSLILSSAESSCQWYTTPLTDTYTKGVCDRRLLEDSANNVAKEVSDGSGNSKEIGRNMRKM